MTGTSNDIRPGLFAVYNSLFLARTRSSERLVRSQLLPSAGLQKTSVADRLAEGGSSENVTTQGGVPVTHRRHHHHHHRHGRRHHHVISIQFILSTRVATPETGDWPEEYHLAAGRLYAMFDAIDGQLAAGQLDDHVTWTDDRRNSTVVVVRPILDSLASARISAVCEIGFQFNASTLMCGT